VLSNRFISAPASVLSNIAHRLSHAEFTSNVASGAVVPIQTLPPLNIAQYPVPSLSILNHVPVAEALFIHIFTNQFVDVNHALLVATSTPIQVVSEFQFISATLQVISSEFICICSVIIKSQSTVSRVDAESQVRPVSPSIVPSHVHTPI